MSQLVYQLCLVNSWELGLTMGREYSVKKEGDGLSVMKNDDGVKLTGVPMAWFGVARMEKQQTEDSLVIDDIRVLIEPSLDPRVTAAMSNHIDGTLGEVLDMNTASGKRGTGAVFLGHRTKGIPKRSDYEALAQKLNELHSRHPIMGAMCFAGRTPLENGDWMIFSYPHVAIENVAEVQCAIPATEET